MNIKMRKIEVDGATADTLEARAAERGLSVAELVAEMTALQQQVTVSSEALAELDRRWTAVEAGEATVPHAHVVRWLGTWGDPDFRPWPKR
jgi:hypothetical protein